MSAAGQAFISAWAAEQRAHGDDMERHKADFEARSVIADGLMAKDPALSFLSAMVVAGDLQTLERSKQWVADGCPALDALPFVGSFGRLEFAVWAYENGHLSAKVLFRRLPDLWRGADPDDTDPRYLRIWKAAKRQNGGRYIRDGDPLPRTQTLTVYRGQDTDAPFGIAWTLDEKVAERFARGAGTRQSDRAGTVFQMDIPRQAVIAYLTGRNESEVILDTIGRTFRGRSHISREGAA